MPTINENTEKSHREEYRIRYVPNAIDNKDGSFKHGFMVQGRTVNHPKLGSSVWENEKAHETLDAAKSHVNSTIKNDKTGKSHYMAHNEGGVHDGNLMGLGEEEIVTIPPLIDTLIDENYVDLRTNIHEVIKSKAMGIIDRIRVEVAENFIDGKKKDDDSDDKDDDKSKKKDKDSDSDDKDDDDKKEKSDKKDNDDDSKEDGKKDKKFPFFMKKKVDEELEIGDEVYILPEGYSIGDKVNMSNPKATPRHQIVGKTKTHYSVKSANSGRVGNVPKSRVAKVNKTAWDLAKQDPEKLQKRITATKSSS